jgi:hypothetical protein
MCNTFVVWLIMPYTWPMPIMCCANFKFCPFISISQMFFVSYIKGMSHLPNISEWTFTTFHLIYKYTSKAVVDIKWCFIVFVDSFAIFYFGVSKYFVIGFVSGPKYMKEEANFSSWFIFELLAEDFHFWHIIYCGYLSSAFCTPAMC